MAIQFYTGVPGSGKSYHCAQVIYKTIQKGKNVIGNIDVDTSVIPNLYNRPKGQYIYVSNYYWLNNSIRQHIYL